MTRSEFLKTVIARLDTTGVPAIAETDDDSSVYTPSTRFAVAHVNPGEYRLKPLHGINSDTFDRVLQRNLDGKYLTANPLFGQWCLYNQAAENRRQALVAEAIAQEEKARREREEREVTDARERIRYAEAKQELEKRAKMLKWTKRDLIVPTRQGESVTISALCCGKIAIHQPIGWIGKKSQWALTDIPSLMSYNLHFSAQGFAKLAACRLMSLEGFGVVATTDVPGIKELVVTMRKDSNPYEGI